MIVIHQQPTVIKKHQNRSTWASFVEASDVANGSQKILRGLGKRHSRLAVSRFRVLNLGEDSSLTDRSVDHFQFFETIKETGFAFNLICPPAMFTERD